MGLGILKKGENGFLHSSFFVYECEKFTYYAKKQENMAFFSYNYLESDGLCNSLHEDGLTQECFLVK